MSQERLEGEHARLGSTPVGRQGSPTALPRWLAAIIIGAIAVASLAALLWPALPFNRQFAGPTGANAPDFEYNAPGGSVLRLSDHRGRVVVVNFWATWCLPCRQEMPALQRVASGESDVVFLEVDLQESGDRARSFMDQLGLDRLRPILDTDGATTRRFGVLTLPSTFFVDRGGVIRHLELGGPLSDEQIRLGIAKAR
ncbi:MAG: hypothetical protein AUJ06_02395 [Chloroflexi bacterium 13_1_40CM_3_70_6]|nr:MAG: hypothetical protein AUJ06_02395 [Chloroflexi bacterium 13_1_40CM_3_70_6]